MRSGSYARGRMEPPISCNFSCSRLAAHWSAYWPEADPDRLAADIQDRLARATSEWELSELRELEGGVVALVCAATQAGRPVVLKLNPRGHRDDPQLSREGDALAFWRSTGAAVELLAQRDGGFTLLMARLDPGDALDDSDVSSEDRLTELGRLAARLHSAGPPTDHFMHLRDFVPGWRSAVPEIDALLAPSDRDVLIHCDLHGGNALREGPGWKAIDPKGLRADRHADVWALLDPVALERLPEDPAAAAVTARRWVDVYAEAAGMDAEKAREWTRLRARAEALDLGAQPEPDPDEAAWVAALHRMADALRQPGRRR
jgi:streptomycin 6-kinase